MESTITLVVSGFGLGFYIPGLLLRTKLRKLGQEVDAEVFETLLDARALDRVEQSRQAYRRDFKLAIASQRVPFDIRNSLDPCKLESLLESWEADKRRRFVALSGHWVHVLDDYQRRIKQPIQAILLYMDGSLAPSWLQTRRLDPHYGSRFQEISLYETNPAQVARYIDANVAPVPWSERERRIVVHGGGWGLGDYESSVDRLATAGYDMALVAYEGAPQTNSPHRLYLADDPGWRVWRKDEHGRLTFPPCGSVGPDGWRRGEFHDGSHGLHQVIARSRAIVSKPGAGTLIDCLASHTPLVMLAPFGAHEETSARIWSELRLGVTLDEWRASNFSEALLTEIHENIVARKRKARDLAAELIEIFGDGER